MGPIQGLNSLCGAGGDPLFFGLQLIAVAGAIAMAALPSGLVSRAIWEIAVRRWVNRMVFEAWRKPPIHNAKSREWPPYPEEPLHSVLLQLTRLPRSAFGLPARALSAQVAARLQAAAEIAPEPLAAFLALAADLPGSVPTPPSFDRGEGDSRRAWAARLIERAVDDLQVRLSEQAANMRYALNIPIAIGIAALSAAPVTDPQTELTVVITGTMAGLAGVLIQNWLARSIDR